MPLAAACPSSTFPSATFRKRRSTHWIEDLRVLDYQQLVLEICRELGGTAFKSSSRNI